MSVFVFLSVTRPHSHVSRNNTFYGWFWNISGFMSYYKQPSRENKSMPARVLNSNAFLGLLTAFFFFKPVFFIMWHQNSVFKLVPLVFVSLWSCSVCTDPNYRRPSGWLIPAECFWYLFYHSFVISQYYFRVPMATAKLWCVSNGIPPQLMSFCLFLSLM